MYWLTGCVIFIGHSFPGRPTSTSTRAHESKSIYSIDAIPGILAETVTHTVFRPDCKEAYTIKAEHHLIIMSLLKRFGKLLKSEDYCDNNDEAERHSQESRIFEDYRRRQIERNASLLLIRKNLKMASDYSKPAKKRVPKRPAF